VWFLMSHAVFTHCEENKMDMNDYCRQS